MDITLEVHMHPRVSVGLAIILVPLDLYLSSYIFRWKMASMDGSECDTESESETPTAKGKHHGAVICNIKYTQSCTETYLCAQPVKNESCTFY